MRSIHARLRRTTGDAPSDRGFTLVELLVVILLFGLVLALAGTLLLNGLKGQQKVVGSSQASNDAQVTMSSMERAIRNASQGGVLEADTLLVTHTGGGDGSQPWRCQAWIYVPPAAGATHGAIYTRSSAQKASLKVSASAFSSGPPSGWTLAVADVKPPTGDIFTTPAVGSYGIQFETQATAERTPGAGVVMKTTVAPRVQALASTSGGCF
ncbi:prepilin-type N-terminal cleavage/methylation domain-containing protein [Sanguibacter keddieii DSM 10542]|uniref:Prepilin-type N-terminal cleavage/methylation domain-containing protein n=1 Tax=Sanguibacter keddieii (strain ATCC 51767 / DSM 10542 / NCFB 3025 / ST-74) TaxID=446469 RepID=D1BGY6_SANKS|nr:prepilin-type N-terminal cleavage/methylation domain-containing protein [Sanguibacter keddieii]ACZ21706.1 prepilin-type N-terminal cleavage/methylation domain-containing protein [Sanguibacter keddieii DSM 10542]